MSAIGPGDWVECVDASPGRASGLIRPNSLAVGALYQVEDVGIAPDGKEGILLVGVRSAPVAWWRCQLFNPSRFRPIYRPKADLIESLKTPAKREGVPA